MIVNIGSQGNYFDRTEAVTLYYNDVIRYAPISKEEELELFNIYFNPDSTESEKSVARDKLLKSQLKFVISVAKTYSNNENYLDMIQQGNLGVLEAIDHFDPTKGTRFNTLAVQYIRRNISQYARDVEPAIRQTNTSKTQHLISRMRNAFIQKYEREPTNEELMDLIEKECHVSLGHETDVLQMRITSISEMKSSDDESEPTNISDMIAFNNATSIANEAETNADNQYNRELLNSLMTCLSDREIKIIKLYYGFDAEKGPLDRFKISEMLGLTPERVRQILKNAINRMKAEFGKKIDLINNKI